MRAWRSFVAFDLIIKSAKRTGRMIFTAQAARDYHEPHHRQPIARQWPQHRYRLRHGGRSFVGVVFLAPELARDFTPPQLAIGRYLAYGLLPSR